MTVQESWCSVVFLEVCRNLVDFLQVLHYLGGCCSDLLGKVSFLLGTQQCVSPEQIPIQNVPLRAVEVLVPRVKLSVCVCVCVWGGG